MPLFSAHAVRPASPADFKLTHYQDGAVQHDAPGSSERFQLALPSERSALASASSTCESLHRVSAKRSTAGAVAVFAMSGRLDIRAILVRADHTIEVETERREELD